MSLNLFNNFIIIFILRLLFLLCGKSLFSAIFKMGSIVFVTYQKHEKLDFIKCGEKKKKLAATGFEPETSRVEVRYANHSAMR